MRGFKTQPYACDEDIFAMTFGFGKLLQLATTVDMASLTISLAVWP